MENFTIVSVDDTPEEMQICKKCKLAKALLKDFRKAGPGYRKTCRTCEDTGKTPRKRERKVIEKPKEKVDLEILPSHGFKLMFDGTSTCITQERKESEDEMVYLHTLILSKHEIFELASWLQENVLND